MRLTDLQIRKLQAPERGQRTYFDDGLPGFGVRISQGGAKSFVVMYGRRRQLKTLGRYPTLGLADARAKAKRVQADVVLEEPAFAETLPEIGFDDARAKFLADSSSRNKPRTVEEYHRLLYRHFDFTKALSEITRADIVAVVDQLRDTPSEQKHAFVAIRTMMNWCVKRGWLNASPVPPLSFSVTTRDRVLSDNELAAVWKRAVAYGYPYGSIVQLLILTGQRRGEAAGLRYGWIEDGLITFPAGFTKNKREHRLPLGPMALGLLETLPSDGELAFPARGKPHTSFNGFSKAKRAFDKPLEIAPYTLHDLRRTYSSNLARLGTPIHVTEKILNHASGAISGVAAVYNRHSYQDEMRTAMERHEAYLKALFDVQGLD